MTFQDFGAIAQLVEHLHGMQGVRGSNPLGSIKNKITKEYFFYLLMIKKKILISDKFFKVKNFTFYFFLLFPGLISYLLETDYSKVDV